MRDACMRAIRVLFACFCLPAVASAVDVQIAGAAVHPGSKSLPARSRLSDASLASSLREDAYPLGAAWQRASLHTEQLRQKAGLLFDLDAAYQQALRDDLSMQGDAIASLRHWVETMPVTTWYRVSKAPLRAAGIPKGTARRPVFRRDPATGAWST